MKQEILTVIQNRRLNASVFELKLSGAEKMRAGQFVELTADGCYLRRPISLARYEGGVVTLLIKEVGKGTEALGRLREGARVDVLTDLGNGFSLAAQKPLLVGGGIGCAPLYQLAAEFNEKGIRPVVVLGFRNADEIYYEKEFSVVADTIIATDDGSRGFRGNVLQAIAANNIEFDVYYACGPTVMMRALAGAYENGQLSLEARMGCGFGACMGCSIKTVNGFKRVCKEGPVFEASEIIWE